MSCKHGNDCSGRGTRWEVSTSTNDYSLQTVFADPYGTINQMGLAIPSSIPTFNAAPLWANRYLVLLASAKFTYGEKFRLVGMRQRVLIGEILGASESRTGFPVYMPQTTPEWHFSDGDISWHLRRVPLQQVYSANVNNAAALAFRVADTPALLFENAPSEGGGYAAPNGGQPPGNVLIPEFGTFHDVRFPWVDDHAWDSLDIEGEGPCAIQLYASIQQTNPSSRPKLSTVIGTSLTTVLPPEDQFVLAYPNAVYTRISGSLIFESPSMHCKELDPRQPKRTPPRQAKVKVKR